MKPITTTLAIALAGALTAATAKAQVCSNVSLAGTFAYTITGSITAPPALAGPFASVGTQTFDGQGGTTAKAMVGQLDHVGARQKEVACHLDNTGLMRAFPHSPHPNNRNAVFDDGSVERPDPRSKNYYLVTSLGEGPGNLLASGRRSSADRRVLVVN